MRRVLINEFPALGLLIQKNIEWTGLAPLIVFEFIEDEPDIGGGRRVGRQNC